jgi:hypothetical protein
MILKPFLLKQIGRVGSMQVVDFSFYKRRTFGGIGSMEERVCLPCDNVLAGLDTQILVSFAECSSRFTLSFYQEGLMRIQSIALTLD